MASSVINGAPGLGIVNGVSVAEIIPSPTVKNRRLFPEQPAKEYSSGGS
ncbi:hypothetical protein N9Z70_00675 [Mariniblastus sp.]|nr:hypothetical protein [Mariniblastus sp.]